MTLPARLRIDAWDGGAASAETTPDTPRWALKDRLQYPPKYLLPTLADENDWRDPRIGWGVILPEPPGDHGVSAADLAAAEDQPAPIRRLLAARTVNGVAPPVFRFKPDRKERFSSLLNYRTGNPVSIQGAPKGTGTNALPQYLLIYASPRDVPWTLQYLLNSTRCVGRLDLREDEGLSNYIDSLLADWGGTELDLLRTVVWAVYHDADDISALLLRSIAARISKTYAADNDLGAKHRFVDGSSVHAGEASLLEALDTTPGSRGSPGVVITTSHGLTDSSLGPAEQVSRIGLPVDQSRTALDLSRLFATAWAPNGAIWYSHGCCTAGSDDLSVYDGLVSEQSSITRVLTAVTDFTRAAGACVAPLPKRLLGAARPVRAFVGHVEPTFDWTLRNPETGQYLTDALRAAMCEQLYGGRTIGRALRGWYERIGPLGQQYVIKRREYNNGQPTGDDLLHIQLSQRDVQSMVILGDPTVRLPL